MKRTALVFSLAMLLSGISVSAMETSSSSSSSASVRPNELGSGEVQDEAFKAAQEAVKKAESSTTRCACIKTRMKECCTNKIEWISNNKKKTFFGVAVTAAVLAIAYKIYSNYKKNAEFEEIYEA